MLQRIKEYIQHAPRMTGVEAFFPAEGGPSYTVAHIAHNGRRVRYVSGATQLDGTAGLSQELGRGKQVALLLHGRGVVHRLLQADADGLKQEELLARYFPNARMDDFHLQRYRGGGVSFFSLIRKDALTRLLDELGRQHIAVLSIALGPFAALSFLGYLPAEEGAIRLDRHHFACHNGHITGYELAGEIPQRLRSVKLGEEEISERYFTAFAAAALEVQGGMYPRLVLPEVEARRKEYYALQQFRRSAKLILGTCLLVLAINTFFFARYRAEADGLSISPNEGRREAVRSLRKEIAEREKMLDGLPLRAGESAHWAEMADSMAGSMPSSISLEEMDFAPQEEGKSRLQRRPVFAEGTLRIKGQCAEMAPLNKWLAAIRQLAFCRTADLVHYAYSSKDELASFTLEIELEE